MPGLQLFWVIKEKPRGGVKLPPPQPTHIMVKKNTNFPGKYLKIY